MTVEQIAALPVASLADPVGAHLYLCTINRYVEDAYRIARAWGFEPSTMLVWAKRPMGGGLGGAFGLSTEFVLFCRRGRCPAIGRIGRSWFDWKRPYDERGKPRHSAKPAGLFEAIERVSPGPRLELFARTEREGWDRWGNEVASTPAVAAALEIAA
jgi:N6-adenosine-specific RNA methylase IME4